MRLDKRLGKALIAIAMALIMVAGAFAQPVGAGVQSGTPVTKPFISSGTIGAQGGNATTLNATTETQTVTWQGFYGEVAGNMSLGNTANDILYSWTNTTNGTIYLSRKQSINFANITAVNTCTVDEAITGNGSDRVNNTFRPSNNSEFIVGGTIIAPGTACAMNTFVNNASQSSLFEEIILTDDGATPIYTTQIEENAAGFDGQPHDWQALVPSNKTTLKYYVYVEFS